MATAGQHVSSASRIELGSLPRTGAGFVGRQAALKWLERCWYERCHIAEVIAWGGVGKSSLVNEWLNRLRDCG